MLGRVIKQACYPIYTIRSCIPHVLTTHCTVKVKYPRYRPTWPGGVQ